MTDASEEWTGQVADAPAEKSVRDRISRFDGRIWSVVTDEVDFDGTVARRDMLIHPGAVAVIALDDRDRVLLIRQYRHPVAQMLFEPPAGLMDSPEESGWATAQRELAEEAGYTADQWHVLLDVYLSPGGMSEAIRVFLARDLQEMPEGRLHTGEAEEAHLPRAWVDLDEARDLVLAGRIGSPSAVTGILAAWVARAKGWDTLRAPDAAWEARDRLIASDRVRTPVPHGQALPEEMPDANPSSF